MPKINIDFNREDMKKDLKLAKRLVKKLKEIHVLIAMLQHYEPREVNLDLDYKSQQLYQAFLHKKKIECTDEQSHQ